MLTRVGVLVLIGAALIYSVVSLPAHFTNLSIAQAYVVVVLGAGLALAGAIWRLRSFADAVAAGLSAIAGGFQLFWPAIEVAFQHIDGGGLPPYANAVFVAGILSALMAIGAAAVMLARPKLAFRLLLAACIMSAAAGLLAPAAPSTARVELTLGMPLLVAAAAAQWLANRRAT
jgi:hypothetical protein